MNKTIIININGIVFHIEEDAYDVLKNYMTDVKRHFANAEDSLEITTDIENRIAEMFTDILNRDARQVIVTDDVNTVITQMGTVEDFETEGSEEAAGFAGQQTFTDSRKLFRDPDDHLVGGVCAGIANYFDIETIWVRFAFAAAFLIGGTGLMLYIILWIIVPKATSRADRMAMKGEKLDLQGFKKNFEEELKNVQATFNKARVEARPFVYKLRDFLSDFFHHFSIFLGSTGHVILKVFGALILLTCFGFFVATVVGFICLLVFGNDVYHLFPFSVINYNYSKIIYVGVFTLIIIPIVGLIMLTFRLVFNSRSFSRSTSYTMIIIWVGALCVVAFYSAKVLGEFKESATFSQTVKIKKASNNTYYLKLNNAKYLTKDDSVRIGIDKNFSNRIILNDSGDDMPRNVSIIIEKSDVTEPVLVEDISAKGWRYEEALRNARNTTYNFIQTDSVLTFDRRLHIPYAAIWRDQEIELTLKIPVDSKIVIDENVTNYFNYGIDFYDCQRQSHQENSPAATFIMTDNGLRCKVDTTQMDSVARLDYNAHQNMRRNHSSRRR